jgi:glycosyltransferase involved in cell wall biosynthesis
MLIGVPIVSTNVGVIPEAITDGENGFISSVKDYKDLAIKIELLLNDIELKDKFIKNSKLKILSEFVTTTIAKQTKSEYEKVLLL